MSSPFEKPPTREESRHKIAAVVFSPGGEIDIRELILCPCGEEDIVVRSLYTMVSSGTELRTLATLTEPTIPGYATIGEVIEIGEKVKNYRVGDLVSGRSCPRFIAPFHAPCGGHASHHVYPATGEDRPVLLPVGAQAMDYVVSEISSICLRGVEAAAPQPGESVIVIGQGLIGALSAAWFHSRGCRVIVTDIEQRRLDRALAWGAFAAVRSGIDAEERLRAYVNQGADIVVEASGSSPGVMLAYRLLRPTPQRHSSPTSYYRGETMARLNHSWPRLVMQATYQKEVTLNPHEFFPGEGMTILTPADRSFEDRQNAVEGLRQGKIRAADFMDRVVSYRDAPSAYRALRDDKDANFSLIFDWSK